MAQLTFIARSGFELQNGKPVQRMCYGYQVGT